MRNCESTQLFVFIWDTAEFVVECERFITVAYGGIHMAKRVDKLTEEIRGPEEERDILLFRPPFDRSRLEKEGARDS